ncbi:MAG: EAL domain-containing protein [Cyanobacteriota bacterium]|nr:EAL domain-containing protein [Cyanobacteriota bacterium]
MSKAKVMIVEDESIIAEDIADSLESIGYSIVGIVSSGEEAIVLAGKLQPDLVLMDIMLQGEMDGIAAAEQIKSSYQIPAIYLTAYADEKTLERVKDTNPLGYIVKPFEEKNLHLTIQIALQRYQYDSLTNLPNRTSFRGRVNEILAGAREEDRGEIYDGKKGFISLLPICYVSLDRINRVTGILGHNNGEIVICSVAKRLLNSVEGIDLLARLEAAEFAIILEPVKAKSDGAKIAQTILDVISQSVVLEDYEIYVTASIGMAFYPEDGMEAEELLKNANTAMYYAQQKGGNNYQFHRSEVNFLSREQLALETSLRSALERSEFKVYYQPQVNIKTGQIIGAEALLRWHNPEKGLVSPAEFIPMAEEMGLIIPLGEWVLRTACLQMKMWQEAGFPQMRVAVNLSRRQFKQKNLSDRVSLVLKETGLEANFLELEITEGMVMQNEAAAAIILKEWQELGIKISIDDFGTGYSSLSYLKDFPFDIIKIDKSFVSNIREDRKTAAITIAIVQLAHSLDLKVIAEGVETGEELDFLLEHECDEIQGYLFSPPVPAEEFEKLLNSDRRL